jgi:hypothetical protein
VSKKVKVVSPQEPPSGGSTSKGSTQGWKKDSVYPGGDPFSSPQQPKTIHHGGYVYELEAPFQWVNRAAGIGIGPLYIITGLKSSDIRYMPNQGFIQGTEALSTMHPFKINKA